MKRAFFFVALLSFLSQSLFSQQQLLTELEDVLTEALNYELRQKRSIDDLNQTIAEQRLLLTESKMALAESNASLRRLTAITTEQSELLEEQSRSLSRYESKLRIWRGVSITLGITTIAAVLLWRIR